MSTNDWSDVLPAPVPPEARASFERAWAALRDSAVETEERILRSIRSLGVESRELDPRLWAAFHAMGGAVPLGVGNREGLLVRAATRGDSASRAALARAAARAALAMRSQRRRMTIAGGEGWMAVPTRGARLIVAVPAPGGGAAALASALTALAREES